MDVYVTQSKTETIINVCGRCECTCDCECNEACITDEYLDIENCSCKKYWFGKLVLALEHEIINKMETSLDDKKVTREKNNCLTHMICIIITCLLLSIFIFVSCYFYYIKHQSKQKNLLTYDNNSNNKFRVIDIDNII